MTWSVNIKNCPSFLGKEILRPINGTARKAAERLIDNPENDFNQGRYLFFTRLL
jgi:hypothetical protein